jgi:peptidoglycan/xylan/chitin deacetylase (PgdA/CDA1 family)
MIVPSLRKLLPLVVVPLAVSALMVACGGKPALATHLSAGCTDGRRIAITFDDGPNPPYTGQILDELVNANVRATFFVEGEAVAADPQTLRREVARGMAVGSHSYSHSKDLPNMSEREFVDDLRSADGVIRPVAGFPPALYRAPYGHTSKTMLRALLRDGYTSIGWDIDSEDWSDAGVDKIVANVLDKAHPGAIVLMHDGGLGGGHADRSATLAALPKIIVGLHRQGYELVTIPELTGVAPSRDAGRRQEALCSAS